MRILWSSSEPACQTGYGISTAEMVRRLVDAGHFIRIATKHPTSAWHYWHDRKRMIELVDEIGAAIDEDKKPHDLLGKLYDEVQGIEVHDGINAYYLNKMIEQEKFDYIVTYWDIWTMVGHRLFPKDKWLAWVLIDSEWIAKRLCEIMREPSVIIAPTKHAVRELRSIEIEPRYAPIGIDTSVFRITKEGRQRFRSAIKLKGDEFLIGSVGLNYGDDRKGFVPLMQAFKVFHERHEEARLYLHTHAAGVIEETINYEKIAKMLGIHEFIYWPDQSAYWMGRIEPDMLANIYNGFDVFCLPTRGEGFGIPIVEAQACGVPVVVADTTSGPELTKTGWLIKCDRFRDREYLGTEGWRLACDCGETLDGLEEAYAAIKTADKDELRRKAREGVLEYDWENVYPTYWGPILAEMEKGVAKHD